MSHEKAAVLLLNLGTPDSTRVSDVRRYLREFLMDERVLSVPYLVRWLIVHLAILPTRPKKSAAAYANIFTPEGSPLLTCGRALQAQLAERLADLPVELGMRYGNPSTTNALKTLHTQGARKIFVIPLYPHYAKSSYETALVCAREAADALDPTLDLHALPPYYAEPGYLEALEASARPYLEEPYDRLLFSYHGIPEKHLRLTDPTNSHCLRCADCCERPSPAHATCYRHQCYETTRLLCERLAIPRENYQVSFQSRLGRDPWLTPYTDQTLAALPAQGVKRLLVMCPAFVADNLETLEEIAIEGQHTFLEAGGESFRLIPCLNTSPHWVEFLHKGIVAWQTTLPHA